MENDMKKFTFADYVKEENSNESLNELNNKFKNGEIKFDYNLVFEVDNNEYKSYRDFNPIISLDIIKDKPVDVVYISEKGGHLCFEYIMEKGSIIPNKVYVKTNEELEKNTKDIFNKLKMK
jgi:hypothetical protein